MTTGEDFSGSVVLVTGGSGGIGRTICRRFAARGARVWVHYNGRQEAAEETLRQLPEGEHRIVGADLRDPKAVRRMVDLVAETSGRLDVLVNNAGIFERHPPMTTDFDAWCETWDRTLGINLSGAAHASYCVARHMAAAGGGRIINISSRGAFRGEPECPAYGASKAGINALSQSLAAALAPAGYLCFCRSPGLCRNRYGARLSYRRDGRRDSPAKPSRQGGDDRRHRLLGVVSGRQCGELRHRRDYRRQRCGRT